ncbi:hypothetical protein PILCRDRAFT_4192 [Piloderma croceum F 1598]|uniref:Uncharacterized protein n=1 Tax=Piloderma croceum (strain F 1598) TaxID=765440 RepID=A0A0C3BKJ7_PILCF|nr:hypothetical protein PILCRDRAFT_4192 [Piloderma croceum F 1598]
MSYHHGSPGYTDYGNHGNDSYNEYKPYLDYTELDHWEPKPTPSKPNHHNYDHVTDPTKYNHHANCEYNIDNTNRDINKMYQPQSSEYKGDKVQELKELIHDGDRTD